jgi:FixJ family two-component response regulator
MTDEVLRRTVAVVEDDAPSRNALGRLLRAGGFEPALFDSAEAFIEAPPSAPLCLILDVHLTGMSGTDLQGRLRKAGSSTPIIVTTALRDASVRHRAEKNGCTAFLWKPFSSDALLSLLGTIAQHPTD